MTYKNTTLKTTNGHVIYIKEGTKTYYTMNGAAKKVPLTTTVKNAAGENLLLGNHGMYNATNMTLGVTGQKVYKKVGVDSYYVKLPGGKMTTVSSAATVKNSAGKTMKISEYKKQKTAATPAATPAINKTIPPGWNNTGKMSNNGKKVYKSGTQLGVFQNGKMVSKFKGKAKLVKQAVVANIMAPVAAPPPSAITPVVAVSLVPIIKPGPEHVKAVEKSYINSVSKVAEKLKELHEVTGKNNTRNIFNNYVAKRGNTSFVHMNRTNRVIYKTTTVRGFHSGGSLWKSSLDKPQFMYSTREVVMNYTQYLAHTQLLFKYGKNVNSFENIRMNDIIDTNWLIAQDKYIRSLSSRQIFTMYGYSYNGDSWAHAYLDGQFSLSTFKQGLPGENGNYFAFFFQARDYYKINTGNSTKDYKAVLDRVRAETDVNNIKNIMNMFINELNEIIRKAPAVTRTFIVFRGQKDDRYMTGMIGNTYTTERFCSTSVDGNVSYDRFSDRHTLQRITLLRGSKCLLMFGATKFADELEILLPRGSTYQIIKKRVNVQSDRSVSLLHRNVYPAQVRNLVDMVCIGTVESAPPVEPVPVTVIPKTNVTIMQNILNKQSGWSLAKITGLIGKGGYGAVYQASDPNFGNVAVKIQKKSNNSNAEIKALKKLNKTNVAPNYYNNKLIKASNNVAKLVPRGIAPGNNVSLLMSKMVRGSPLSKWYTGAPVPQNIKNKVKQAVSNMHKKGVIHGDLHKNNIIIGNNGKAYVIDFGKSLVTNKSFNSTNEANEYLKKLTGKVKSSYGKTSWYSNNKRTHFANGNFLRRMK